MRRRDSGSIPRLLLLAVTVAGLFAMHGLADHGTTTTMPMGHAAAMSGHQRGATVSAPADGHDAAMAMGLCLALLVAAGVVLGSARRGRVDVAALPATRVHVVGPLARARSPDPLALGVCRC